MNTLRRVAISLSAASLACLSFAANAQTNDHPSLDRLAWSRDFLRVIYPDSRGKNFRLTVTTTVLYDVSAPVRILAITVGNGPKDLVIGQSAGCMGTLYGPSSPMLTPPELPPSSQVGVPLTTAPGGLENCHPLGAIHPEQFLDSEFQFDEAGYCTSFLAGGPGVGRTKQMLAFAGQVLSHPEWSSEQLISSFNELGGKYGPADKEKFIKHIPIANLERFLGKVRVLSAKPLSLEEFRRDAGSLPDFLNWTVEALALRSDGTHAKYLMTFEQFNGDLTSIRLISPAL